MGKGARTVRGSALRRLEQDRAVLNNRTRLLESRRWFPA
jgi:hypothetical protein